jgi:uncharacterized membrane protein
LKYLKLIAIYFFGPAYIYIGVYLSGFFEILLGAMLLFNKYRVVAAKGLILLLIAVFPANIYLAQSSLAQSLLDITQETAIIRLPFQVLFLLFAYWFTKK